MKKYQYKIIYVAPERLLNEFFLEAVSNLNIAMISIDEAHCISQWGQNFRPSYLKIIEFVSKLPKRPIISGFTATATWQVRDDIVEILNLHAPEVVITGFDRKNLYYEVKKPKDKYEETASYIDAHKQESGIVYCQTRKLVEEISKRLEREGISVTRYHAGLTDQERRTNQDAFIYDQKQVMVATNAFGMGIDKPNVNYVIHYNMPKDIESYYQEAGRAGRDGEKANCILLYSGKDVVTNQFFIEHNEEQEEMTREERQFILEKDRERLRKMTFYCFTNECLRDYMLRYFNEYGSNYCGNCSNCLTKFEQIDVTKEAKALIGCVKSTRQRYGINVIIDTLRGSKAVRVRQYGLDTNEYYGRLHDKKDYLIRQILNYMMLNELLFLTQEEYPILKLTKQSLEVEQDRLPVIMKIAAEEPKPKKTAKRGGKGSKIQVEDLPYKEELFEELRELRRKLAIEQNVPPYIVFNDRTLKEMAARLPVTESEILTVSGVGAAKYQKYGVKFIKIIEKYK